MSKQGNEYGSVLRIQRVSNGWIACQGGSREYCEGGREWAFQDAGSLGRFIAKWCEGMIADAEGETK